MDEERILDNETLKKILEKFCKEKNYPLERFEIARIGQGYGSGDRKTLYGPKSVKNKDCTYVIKIFLKYDLVVIWNYDNKAMSCPYETLKTKLDKGICTYDKGRCTHPNDQTRVLFEHTKNFLRLLYIIAEKM